jgi:hypothetical protein
VSEAVQKHPTGGFSVSAAVQGPLCGQRGKKAIYQTTCGRCYFAGKYSTLYDSKQDFAPDTVLVNIQLARYPAYLEVGYPAKHYTTISKH